MRMMPLLPDGPARLLGLLLAGCVPPLQAACVVSATGLAFGPVNPLSGAPVDSAGTLTVNCAETTAYSIALVPGTGPGGLHEMTSGPDSLLFGLYVDPLRSIPWGDGSGGSQVVAGSAGPTGSAHTVHGRLPPQPLARAGHYAGVVVVQVTW
ncbi:MAG: spore coat protein U domain-containing protein [Xanthomonadales bacterium]|nr:spore coat protein U domain-containing protein [Xanthomonadales bacterium]